MTAISTRRGRPPTLKSGAMSDADRARRYRRRQKKLNPSAKTVRKQQRRAERERTMAKATVTAAAAALGTKLYGVLYVDPPWRFEPYSRATGMDRAADNHYPTMHLDAIKTLKIPAAPDCVLFLWATAPMLPQALDVMAAWGFAYRTHMIWEKDRTGTGYWARNKHELLLIGSRGRVPAPAPGDQSVSVINAPVGEHSRKPDVFAEMIKLLYPNVPKIELFARRHRDGWDSWGNGVEPSGSF